MTPRFPSPPPQYDARDQTETRRISEQAFLQIQSVLASLYSGDGVSGGSDPALTAQVAVLESTMTAVLAALVAAGIVVGAGSAADFSVPDNSGLLVLFSIGGL
jgi:hypothetical protein